MFTRRDFLAMSGLLAAGAGLEACMPVAGNKAVQFAGFLRAACRRRAQKQDPLWGAELRGKFRELECMVNAILAVPEFEKIYGKETKRRFWELHRQLSAHSLSRALAETWYAFYDLTARLHEVRNARAAKAAIPVYAHNGHQHSARMWLDESVRRDASMPLLHFDTHNDMSAVGRPGRVVDAVRHLSSGGRERKKAMKNLIRLIPDHATPVTAGVLGRGVGDVVWAFPDWSFSVEFERRPALYANLPRYSAYRGTFRLLHDPAEDTGGPLPEYAGKPWIEMDALSRAQLRGMEHVRRFHLTYVRTFPHRNVALQVLLDAIPRGRFVLDVDLDYFMSIDAYSGFRRPGNGWHDRMARLTLYEQKLNRARKLLDRRITEFENLLATLRDAGRIPAHVTIADSTYMPFAPSIAARAHWEYTPREFAGYVHWRVRRVLASVFRKQGIDAWA